jgi:hypothetical protein
MKPEFIEIIPPERCRRYLFADGHELMFHQVLAVHVSDSGTHRLNLGNGMKAIIPPGWRCILLDIDDWTF